MSGGQKAAEDTKGVFKGLGVSLPTIHSSSTSQGDVPFVLPFFIFLFDQEKNGKKEEKQYNFNIPRYIYVCVCV